MQPEYLEADLLTVALSAASAGVCIGRIVEVAQDGRARVEFAGNQRGPLVARSLVTISVANLASPEIFPPVLLLFENQDQALPIIAGFVRDSIVARTPENAAGEASPPAELVVDGKRRKLIEAHEEIELRCGKSSIILRKDGRIAICGKDIVNRATGTNRIKGGSVAIN